MDETLNKPIRRCNERKPSFTDADRNRTCWAAKQDAQTAVNWIRDAPNRRRSSVGRLAASISRLKRR